MTDDEWRMMPRFRDRGTTDLTPNAFGLPDGELFNVVSAPR